MVRADAGGLRAWGMSAVAGAISVPVVVGFMALGAAVVLVRSVRELARETWARLPNRRASPPPARRETSHAA
ncbi:MAG TPA: hypothetical protein VLI07_19900 [Candidatus Binatus sp.]|jgi:hypothetical protein|nr:hypothetical protein [Candidatus Binatus sp.]